MFGVSLLLAAAVWAQDFDPPAPVVIPPPPPAIATPLADGLVWELRARLPTRLPLDAVAVEPGGGRVWLAADAAGAVFRSPDAGSSWSLVLPPSEVDDARSDEEILLDAERAQEDEQEDPTDAVDTEDPTPDIDVEADVGNVATDAADVASRVILDASGLRETVASARVWFDPGDPNRALVGRTDGVWRSVDLGESWSLVVRDVQLRGFLRVGPAIVAAGDGVRVSLDGGETWIVIEGPLAAVQVAQLAEVGERLYAAGDDGLYVSSDTFHWDRLPMPGTGPLSAVVADPDWVNGLWVARAEGLYRSDDGGSTFYMGGRQPLAALSRLVHLGEPGHLVAASREDGVWESLDGGTLWQPVVRLLTEPRVYDLALIGRRPVIATASGVWELVAPTVLAEEQPVAGLPGLDLGETIAVALARAGLDLAPASLSGRDFGYRMTPKLVFTGTYAVRASRDADYFAEDTVEGHDRALLLTSQLCWGACDTLITYSFGDDLESLIADELVDTETYVLGDEVYVSDDSSAPIAAAANVSQDLNRYRVTLAEQVADAWLARRRLAADGPLGAGAPVREQAFRIIQLAELNARLDAYTGGAYTQSLRPSETTP